jgi:fumarate hydratase, class II
MAPRKTLYGSETKKAVDNFPISGETVPISVVHWLGRIKGAAARANADLGKLDPKLADAIARAGDEVAAGDHDAQFPIDVFQTGSGTSSNMNANEVLAALAGEGVHANDHVNMGQSSNDVFPSAVHLAALDRATNQLLPALKQLERSLARKATRFKNVVKSGRTHLMDAVPVTLGQEFGGYAAQVRLGQERVEAALVHVRQIPLGGTATGTGLNTHPKFAEKVRRELSRQTKLKIDPPADPFEAQANRDALVELSGALKVVAVSLTKIAQDIALMGSGPRAGIGEIFLPELQKGSSIMPGKVNPVMPEVVLQVAAQVIGNDAAITVGGLQGQFELNVRIPLIARNLLQSITLLSTTSIAFAEKCIDGITVNKAGAKRSAESTLAVATALNEHIGYDKGTTIVQRASESGRTLREIAIEEGVEPALYDRIIDLRKIAAGNQG